MTRRSVSESTQPSLAMRNRRRASIAPRQEFILRDSALKDLRRQMRVSKLYNRLWLHFAFCGLIFTVLLLQRSVFKTHDTELGLAANLAKVVVKQPGDTYAHPSTIHWVPGTAGVVGITTVNEAWTWAEAIVSFFTETQDWHEVSQVVCCVRVRATGISSKWEEEFIGLNSTLPQIQAQISALRTRSSFSLMNRGSEISLDPVIKERFTNFLTVVRFDMQVRAGGAIKSTIAYRTTRSTFYRTTLDYIRLFLEIIYFFVVVFRLYKSVSKGREYLSKHSWRSWLRAFWGPLDFLDAAGHAVLALFWILITALPLLDENNPRKVVDNVHRTFLPYDLYFVMAFYLTMIMLLKLFKYVDVESKFGSFFHTIQVTAVDIVHFLIVMIVLISFYAVLGFFLFGEKLEPFADPQIAFQTIVEVILSQFAELRETLNNFGDLVRQRWVPRLYFWSLVIFMNLVLLNVFIAIVLEAYHEMAKVTHLKSTVWHDVKTGLILRINLVRTKLGIASKNVMLPRELYRQFERAPVVINFHCLTQDVCGGNPIMAEGIMRRYGHTDEIPMNPNIHTPGGGDNDASSVGSDGGGIQRMTSIRTGDVHTWGTDQVLAWLMNQGLSHDLAPNFENYDGKELSKLTLSDWQELAGPFAERFFSLLHPNIPIVAGGATGAALGNRKGKKDGGGGRGSGRGSQSSRGGWQSDSDYYSYYSDSEPPRSSKNTSNSARRHLPPVRNRSDSNGSYGGKKGGR